MNENIQPEEFPGLKRCETPFCPEVQAQVELWRALLRVQRPNHQRGVVETHDEPQRPFCCDHQTRCQVQPRPGVPANWERCRFL